MTTIPIIGTGPTLLLSDPLVTGIPVVEDGSPVVDLASVGVRVRAQAPDLPLGLGLGSYAAGAPTRSTPEPTLGSMPGSTPGSSPGSDTAPGLPTGASMTGRHRLVRRTLAERLREADALLPRGLHLLVVEGLRPLGAQQLIHAAYRARLAGELPSLDASDLDRLASRFVAPPATAPHVSGAAVDLTLADDDGRPLDLGCPIDATPEESDGACYFDAAGIADEARLLRTALAGALHQVGLVNYPTEWWHWSFGDRYWAHVTGSPFAIHGPIARTETLAAD
jgi:D-alanyl-D-alanine dipeptidase